MSVWHVIGLCLIVATGRQGLKEIKENAAYDVHWQVNILLSRKYLQKMAGKNRGLIVTEAGAKALQYGPNPDVDASTIPKRWDNIRRLHDDEDAGK